MLNIKLTILQVVEPITLVMAMNRDHDLAARVVGRIHIPCYARIGVRPRRVRHGRSRQIMGHPRRPSMCILN